jgi:hypothetical protein
MAVIYLRHPTHGAKVAISETEADADEMHGWERFDPTEPTETANEMAAPKRRGRLRANLEG